MSEPLLPFHRFLDCTGSWQRQQLGGQRVWRCSHCLFAFADSPPVAEAVLAESQLEQLLAGLAAAGEHLMARERLP